MEKLLEPNVVARTEKDEGEWTAGQVKAMICNPVYAGLGPYPQIVEDELWVRCAMVMVRQEGLEQFLVNMLSELRSTFREMESEFNVEVNAGVESALSEVFCQAIAEAE